MPDKQQPWRTGMSFGLTSGVITTLGLIVGLHSGTHSRTVVIGGIVVIAVADALSDALGIHLSEEAENVHTTGQIWMATVATLFSKFVIALSFLVPVLLFDLPQAITISIVWGLLVVAVLSFYIARVAGQRPIVVVAEHIVITLVVLALAHVVGDWVAARLA